MTRRSLASLFVAPPDAPRGEVRRAGLVSVAVGAAVAVAAGLALARAARTVGRGPPPALRLGLLALALVAYVLAAQGAFRAVTGVARGAAPPDGGRAARAALAVLTIVGFFATAFALLAASSAPAFDAAARTPEPRGIEIPMPADGENEATVRVGDASITVIRVQRDGGREMPSRMPAPSP